MTDNTPEPIVHEGIVVGTPTKRYWGVNIKADRGGFVVRCECREILSDGAFPRDIDALMTTHVRRRHSE